MKKWIKRNWEIILIVFITLLMFYKPLFSNQPLGLDAIGHLSKVSYIQQFGFVNWDMSWYSGSLFLKMYPLLFYYVNALFPSNAVPFGANLICFLSLLFTILGIYLLINYLTKSKKIALIFSLSFLTILSISYYWIATGNLPYFSALWTIPFSLYFLEKSIREKEKKYFVFFALVFFISIATHVVTGFLIGIFMIIRFLFEGFNFKNIKKILFYGGIPVLLSSFWFIPFLYFSKSAGEYSGYVPDILSLFGFGNCCWGLKAGGIGVVLFSFLLILFFSFKKMNKDEKYYLSLCGVLGFLMMGGLWKYYPFGVDPVRFILPFSVLIILFSGLIIHKLKLLKNKKIFALIIFILIIGLIWNFSIVNQNFEKYNYVEEGSRYLIMKELVNNPDFLIKNEITNYRLGTSRYVFGETINYFMPSVQHTFGYQDAGMLNQPRYYDMKWHIWDSEEINDSIYWLDWFGIRYFEGTFEELNKFENDSRFKKVGDFYPTGYNFVLYEYKDAKPIISLVDSLGNETLGKVKNFSIERNNPDEIKIIYDNFEEGNAVVFKEFYHKNWVAKELNSGEKLKVVEAGPGFMAVYPNENSKGIELYYKKNFIEWFSIILSLISFIFLFLFWKSKKFKYY
jgi:hypothetical protein